MISEYIKSALDTIENNKNETGLGAVINSCIKVSIIQWEGFGSSSPDGTLSGLVDYMVNIYMVGLTKEARLAKKKAVGVADPWQPSTASPTATTADKIQAKKGKTIRLFGRIRITNIGPANPQGQIEDGSIVSFVTKYTLYMHDMWDYIYNPTTGVYTVYNATRTKTLPLPAKHLYGGGLSEQMGELLFDQDPSIKTATSVVTDRTKRVMFQDKQDLMCRIDGSTAAYIRDKKYYEFKNPTVGIPPVEGFVITKTIDLSSWLPTTTGENVSIAKYLKIDDIIFVLVMTDVRYLDRWGADQDPDMCRHYFARAGEAKIKGEILIINRTTEEVTKLTSSLITASQQIRWTGYMDMIRDNATGNVIFAELSATANTKSLTYTTAEMLVKKEDRVGWYVGHPTLTDFIGKTAEAWYAWLNPEAYYKGYPKAIHVKKGGSKTWVLDFPKLTIKSYKINQGKTVTASSNTPPSVTFVKTHFEDTGAGFTTKHDKDCVGGYINCMLYQDIHTVGNPIYLGRCYDAWLQVPYPSDDYTIVTEAGSAGQMHADKGKYHITPLPGELVGFFGIDFYKLVPGVTPTLKLIGDIPGDYCHCRSFMKDDIPGWPISISGVTSSTHTSLLILNDLVSTNYINNIRTYSMFNVYTAGSGANCWALPPVVHTGMGIQRTWNQGLRINTQRFIVIKDKLLLEAAREDPTIDVPELIVFAGSYEYQIDSYVSTNEQYKAHAPYNSSTRSSTGVYILKAKDPAKDYWEFEYASLSWALVYPTNNPIPPRSWGRTYYSHYQTTVCSIIADIVALDNSSYYLNMSCFTNQYDTFYTLTGAGWNDGLLWWFSDRQSWLLKNNVLSGWAADVMYFDHGLNSAGTAVGEEQGPSTISLQYF